MTELDLLSQKIAEALLDRMKPAVPLSVDLWDLKTIAAYLKRNPRAVGERIVTLPDFPRAIRLPSMTGKRECHPLWRASEVIQWAESHMEREGTAK